MNRVHKLIVTGGRSELDGRDMTRPSIQQIYRAGFFYNEFDLDVIWRGSNPTATFTRDVKDNQHHSFACLREFLRRKGFDIKQEFSD